MKGEIDYKYLEQTLKEILSGAGNARMGLEAVFDERNKHMNTLSKVQKAKLNKFVEEINKELEVLQQNIDGFALEKF